MPSSSGSNAGETRQQIVFPCEIRAARDAVVSLRNFLGARGLDEQLLFACELSLMEGCNNAVHHADERGRTQNIVAEVALTSDYIDLSVRDHTPGFEYPGPLPPPAPNIEKGRGLFLIQSMMDEVSYTRHPDGNVLRMRKRRDGKTGQYR